MPKYIIYDIYLFLCYYFILQTSFYIIIFIFYKYIIIY